MEDKEVIEHIKALATYCGEHEKCQGCIFYPKDDYRPVKNECLINSIYIQDLENKLIKLI